MHNNKENLRFIQIHAAAVRVESQPYLSPCTSLMFPACAWPSRSLLRRSLSSYLAMVLVLLLEVSRVSIFSTSSKKTSKLKNSEQKGYHENV